MANEPRLIHPDWPAPPAIRAAITTRVGGVSDGPYRGLNLATHVGDDPQAVAANRALLRERLGFPGEPRWLTQVHGCTVADDRDYSPECEADAVVSGRPGEVCAVLTADCLPLLVCNRAGGRVAAIHAGWRGLAAGVIERTLDRFPDPPVELLVWLGPAIGPAVFEVGAEVRAAFVEPHPADAAAFTAGRPGHWLADIYLLARARLARCGVGFIGGGTYCTVSDPERFYSYRRDGVTGRFASLIWIEEQRDG